jgi:hypothetical protein
MAERWQNPEKIASLFFMKVLGKTMKFYEGQTGNKESKKGLEDFFDSFALMSLL